jgi:hypothetical protein
MKAARTFSALPPGGRSAIPAAFRYPLAVSLRTLVAR